ncbi:uncharacterized protein [Diadema antillarum]|uniref:uncharacterized protein n=1 Tax=Diadema antillarum TaxID=105358 RepID=UPI003A864EB0
MESFHDSADSLDDDDPIAVGQPPRGQIHSVPMRDATDVKDSRSRPDVDDKQYLETTQDCHHELLPSYLPVGGSGDSVDVSPEEKLSSLESSPRKVEGMEARLACINSSDEEELVVGHKRNGDVSPMKEWNKTNNNIEQTGVKRNAATETSTICSDETVEHGHPVQCSAGYPDNVSDCAASLDNYNSLPHKPNLKESREHPVDLTMNVGSETGNKDRTILPNESERCKDTINTAVPVSSRKSSLRSRRGQRDRAVVDDSGSVEKKVGDTFSLSFADGENVEAPTTKVTRSNSLQLIQDFSQNEEQDASKQGEKSPKLVGNSEASEETNKGPDSPSHNGKPSIGQPMRGGSENLRLEQSGAESPLLQCPSLTHSHPIDCKQEGLSAGSESESNAVSQQREKAAGKRGRKGNRQPKRKENTAALAASPDVACSTSPDAGSGKDRVQQDQRDCQIAHSTGCDGGLAKKVKRKMRPYTRRRKRKCSVKTKVEARAKEEEEEEEDEDEDHWPLSKPTGFPSEAKLGNASPALNTRFSSFCDDDDDDDEELVDPVLTPNSKTRDLLPDIALEDVVWALNPGDQRYWPAVVTMIPDSDSKVQMYQVVRTTDDMLQDEGFPCRARNVRLYNCRDKAKFKVIFVRDK